MKRSPRFILVFVMLCISLVKAGKDSTYFVQIHFLYGSKPARGHKSTEIKFFGGLHGGHVTLQLDSNDYGFEPAYGFHVFAHKKNFKSDYVNKVLVGTRRYPEGNKVATFYIPLKSVEYQSLKSIVNEYSSNTPYDYAFFGMRCAASTREILAQIGLLKKRKRCMTIITTFYPKKLRKQMFKLAEKNGYQVVLQSGRSSRKWEKD